ncbi:hypothetical protein HYH03_006843 [Edaphochlamys debaryana]|uniref:Uncharacterized protein n=1 Tax=Edaphochlamys debaryana TaxID=47281 RepID=A0A836C0V0_9CHLO|nr:hypothetical protein HYH03_006843 [Edaphochlamys debaryana]|eukprot:KAG2494908.1 hypothetical protein HYH03_006843 [Edaphochlamys debaryana]
MAAVAPPRRSQPPRPHHPQLAPRVTALLLLSSAVLLAAAASRGAHAAPPPVLPNNPVGPAAAAAAGVANPAGIFATAAAGAAAAGGASVPALAPVTAAGPTGPAQPAAGPAPAPAPAPAAAVVPAPAEAGLGAPARVASWPEDLTAWRPCVNDLPLLDVHNDASGLAADPSSGGSWWLVTDKPLAAMQYDRAFGRVLQKMPLPGVQDPEAIAWMGPNRLAVAEEMGNVVIFSVAPGAQPAMGVAQLEAQIPLQRIVRQPNKGIEGMAYDSAKGVFYLAQPQFSASGLSDLKDLSELTCYGPTCSSLLILSQRSKRIAHVDLSGRLLSSLRIKGLPRPEVGRA